MADWTAPITWSNSAVVGQTEMNEQIRDNMAFLKDPTFTAIYTAHTAAGRMSATSTTAVPLTAGMSATLTTFGGDLNVFFRAKQTGVGSAVWNLEYNGTALTVRPSGLANTFQNEDGWYDVWVTGLASGTHTFVPTWLSVGGGVRQIDASSFNLEFWVREG